MPRVFYKGRDPVSSYTHFVGAVFSVIGTILLISKYFITNQSDIVLLIAIILFGLSMIALYNASSIYHFVNFTGQKLMRMRKLDHSMIYVLIAGTYTPLSLRYMPRMQGIIFVSVMWALAIIGIIIKICWFNAPRWLYTSLYLIMGWAIIFDIPGFSAVPIGCLILLAAGGIAYSAGAVIYIIKKPNISKAFGFHEIFHLFIMLGTLLHFASVFFYII